MSIKVIEINSPEQLEAQFKKLAHTLHNLRFFTKYWNEHGGYRARLNMNNWQEKADLLLDEMGLTLHNNISSVKIIKY